MIKYVNGDILYTHAQTISNGHYAMFFKRAR